MAIPIKTIPELKGKAAERFTKAADNARRGFIDFSKQIKICSEIIRKSLDTETYCQSDEMKEILSTKKGEDDIIHSIKNPDDQKIKLIEI